MTNLIQTQIKKVAEEKIERGTRMASTVTIKPKKQKNVSRRIGKAYQQNLIEMIGYIYLSRNEYNLEDMAHEMSKSVRTIHRFVDDINSFYPLIKKTTFEDESKVYLSIGNDCSEERFDCCYKRMPNAPILYLFLIMLFNRPLSHKEIMEKLNLKSRAKAKKIAEQILDCSYIIDYDFKEDDVIVGNWKFIY